MIRTRGHNGGQPVEQHRFAAPGVARYNSGEFGLLRRGKHPTGMILPSGVGNRALPSSFHAEVGRVNGSKFSAADRGRDGFTATYFFDN